MGRDQANLNDDQEGYLGFTRRFGERDEDGAEEERDEERDEEVISLWLVLGVKWPVAIELLGIHVESGRGLLTGKTESEEGGVEDKATNDNK
jgi:hypothetical protein